MATMIEDIAATAIVDADEAAVVASNADDDTTKNQSRLMALATELRLIIFQYALVTDKPINFSKEDSTPPGLLFANHQIRDEACPIYYRLNIFDIHNPNFNPIALQAFRVQSKPYLPDKMIQDKRNVRVEISLREAKWENVIEWAKLAHQDFVLGAWSCKGECVAEIEAVTRVVFVAASLKDVEWEKVRGILEQMRVVSELERVEWVRG